MREKQRTRVAMHCVRWLLWLLTNNCSTTNSCSASLCAREVNLNVCFVVFVDKILSAHGFQSRQQWCLQSRQHQTAMREKQRTRVANWLSWLLTNSFLQQTVVLLRYVFEKLTWTCASLCSLTKHLLNVWQLQSNVADWLVYTYNLVLSPGNPSAAAHDSDSALHEYHTYFFPDCGRGAANTAGFGWRGGSGV